MWRLAFTALVIAALVVSACGGPDPEHREFVFTPVVYTPVAESSAPCPLPVCGSRGIVADGPGRGGYYADQVWIFYNKDDESRVVDILDSYEWSVIWRSEFDLDDMTNVVVQVPLGGAREAALELQAYDVIESAEPHGFFSAN